MSFWVISDMADRPEKHNLIDGGELLTAAENRIYMYRPL